MPLPPPTSLPEPHRRRRRTRGVRGPSRRAEIVAALQRDPRRMTVQLARELGVPEEQGIRALPASRATELDVSHWEELLRALEPLGRVHVIVTNGAVTLEAFGTFGNFST